MKKTNTYRKAGKSKNSKNPMATTRVAANIGILGNGTYKARKTVEGVTYSKNCSSLNKAKIWLKSL